MTQAAYTLAEPSDLETRTAVENEEINANGYEANESVPAESASGMVYQKGFDLEGILDPEKYQAFFPLLGRAEEFLPWAKILDLIEQFRISDVIFNRGILYMRSRGEIEPFPQDCQPGDPVACQTALISMMQHERTLRQLVNAEGASDFSLQIQGRRFRGNIYFELSGYNGVFRPIPQKPLGSDMLMLEKQVQEMILTSKQGLVIVAGPTGSGKSSTVVALLEDLNYNCNYNIITIEDPIEYVFTPQRCTFSQREVGEHASSFDSALRSAMRQNPDVIFVGEIRDYPTMAAALKAAETGHLVFATLHTRRVYTTLTRLINIAPASERDQIRDAIAQNVLCIMCQRLIPSTGGVVPCREIVIRNNALIGCINSGKFRDINQVMLSNRQHGMVDWNSALNNLIKAKLISQKDATLYRDKEDDI